MPATSEVAARRHSVGERREVSAVWISSPRAGTARESSPRAQATWRHTSVSRSSRSERQAPSMVSGEGRGASSPRLGLSTTAWKSWAGSSSPLRARAAASRAARSRRRPARRRSGSDPMACVPSHEVDSSRRETSARASGSTCTSLAAGSPSAIAARARIPAPESARAAPPTAMRVEMATNVAASPS